MKTKRVRQSVRSIYTKDGTSIVGNVVYLSNKNPTPQAFGKLNKWLSKQSWYKDVTSRVSLDGLDDSWRAGWLKLEALQIAMDHPDSCYIPDTEPFRLIRKEVEPPWIESLPPFARRHLRCNFAMTDGMNPLAIIPIFPYMGFGYIIPDSGMSATANEVFKIFRLSGIKQLSFLHDPVIREYDRSAFTLMFEHTRYCHVLDTYAVANLIAENIGLEERARNTLLTAAISHDALTPAGGDSVKLIDPEQFDEDLHYPELLAGEAWEEYRERFNIDRDLLVQTIMGQGLLGRILDIADKSSYLARDINAYLMASKFKKDARNTNLYAVTDIVTDDPYACAIWESAQLYKNSLVFEDTGRLARFLKLRALMFRGLYYNPYSRFFEYLMGKGVVKYLYENKMITRRELLDNQDHWIEQKIDEALGSYAILRKFNNLEKARIEEYHDIGLARKRVAEFDNDLSTIVILDSFVPMTSSGTRKFHIRKGNEVIAFADEFIGDTEEIEAIMTFPKIVRLFFLDTDDLELSQDGKIKLKDIMRSVS